jgi:hypothetical protein
MGTDISTTPLTSATPLSLSRVWLGAGDRDFAYAGHGYRIGARDAPVLASQHGRRRPNRHREHLQRTPTPGAPRPRSPASPRPAANASAPPSPRSAAGPCDTTSKTSTCAWTTNTSACTAKAAPSAPCCSTTAATSRCLGSTSPAPLHVRRAVPARHQRRQAPVLRRREPPLDRLLRTGRRRHRHPPTPPRHRTHQRRRLHRGRPPPTRSRLHRNHPGPHLARRQGRR